MYTVSAVTSPTDSSRPTPSPSTSGCLPAPVFFQTSSSATSPMAPAAAPAENTRNVGTSPFHPRGLMTRSGSTPTTFDVSTFTTPAAVAVTATDPNSMPFDFNWPTTGVPGVDLAVAMAPSRIDQRSSVISCASSCRRPLPKTDVTDRTLRGVIVPFFARTTALCARPADVGNGSAWHSPHACALGPLGPRGAKRGTVEPSSRTKLPTPSSPLKGV